MDVIKEWGSVVKPTHDDSLAVPPNAEEIELR